MAAGEVYWLISFKGLYKIFILKKFRIINAKHHGIYTKTGTTGKLQSPKKCIDGVMVSMSHHIKCDRTGMSSRRVKPKTFL